MNYRPDDKTGALRVLVQRLDRVINIAGRHITYAMLALLAFALTSVPVHAQSNAMGSVFGRVVGTSAAELSGATVTLLDTSVNQSRSTAVSSAGTFDFPAVPVGDYDVTLAIVGRDTITQTAHVGLGSTTSVRFVPGDADTITLEKMVVRGSDFSPVDVTSTVIGLNILETTVDMLPVARNLTAVSLLTPGVTPGDRGFFGNLASFAGASVGENAYYINGYNITDFRRGLGYSGVPFEFFQEFQTLTSGYSAEFGRSTGGVVNAVSKRGSNQFKATVSLIYEPKELNESGRDTFGSDGKAYVIRSLDETERRTWTFEASGPLWKDHIFFYGLYQGNSTKQDYIAPTTSSSRNGTVITSINHRTNTSPTWAGKFDWQIVKGHLFEYTTFSDQTYQATRQSPYLWTSNANMITFPAGTTGTPANTYVEFGGRSEIYRYTGNFFDDVFTISALYGSGLNASNVTSDVSAQAYVVDNRTAAGRLSGAGSLAEDEDKRRAKRLDGVLRFSAFGSHALKFGYDLENNVAHSLVRTSGNGVAYTYENYTGGPLQNGATPPAGTASIAQVSVYSTGGDFRVITEAFYVEDNWKLMDDRLNLNIGLREEMLDNRNGNDITFVKIEGMRAPRVSAAYDLNGDGLSKVFASWGRYFLQIPANTNARMAAGEIYYTDYYVLNSLKADFTPNLGPQVGGRVTTGTGVVPGVETLVNADIKPMYQDEFTVGYERALGKKWKASIKGIYRNLAQTLEDSAVDAALDAYAQKKGYNLFEVGGFDYYVLTNPGGPVTFYVNMTKDLDGDGVVDYHDQNGGIASKEKVTLDAGALGYPKATRKYYSAYLGLERAFADKWMANLSYVWAHSYGNYEGSVYSDVGQRDAGITQLFDQPGLVDGSDGPQPNDRRHTFKAFGAYQLTKELLFSGAYTAQSGRPKNGLGPHPTDLYARAYGGSSYYVDGVLVPRGSLGRTPWIHTLDIAARYKPTWGKDKLSFGLDIFNVLNWQRATAVFERSTAGTSKLVFFGADRSIQTPRYVRISAAIDY